MITDWQHVMKKAWSVRLIAVAGLLSGLELILPMFGADIPRNWYAIATMAVTTLALIARVVAQKEFGNETAD